MPNVMFLDTMDAWASQGCQDPDCRHEHDDDPLALSSRCHPGTGVCIGVTDHVDDLPCIAILQCRCWTCHQEVGNVALAAPFSAGAVCPHRSAMDVLYQDGRITVECRTCETMAFTATVPALTDTTAA